MEKTEFKNLLKKINDGIKKNTKIIDKYLNEEFSKGNNLNIKKLSKIISNYEKIEVEKTENKSLAVCYSGLPEITITYILDSILYNNKITLCVNGFKNINTLIVKLVLECMKSLKIQNQWINYSPNYNEIYLKDNEKLYNKIIYIGDFFEYQRFKTFFKKKVEYNNFGHIKLFIDKIKFKQEYNKITKFAYKENISLEIYDDIDDFVGESREEDFSIIYADVSSINQIKRGLRAGQLLINAFPYDTYKFEIER